MPTVKQLMDERAAAVLAERDRCARIAEKFIETRADLRKSDNPSVAMTIAAIMSETGSQIAAAIRKG